MSAGKTCYHPPMFTPVIVNKEAGYTQTCGINVWSYIGFQYTSILCNSAQVTGIPDGPLTISHTGAMLETRKPPVPLVITIGPSPPATAKETATVTSTATALSTITTWGGYKSTHTDYRYVATWTRNIWVPASETTTRTHYVTACPAKSTPSPPAVPPGVLLNKCDEDNGKMVYTEAGPFEITCGYELDVKTSGRMQSKNGMLGCIDLCVEAEGCTGMVYFEPLDDCYLKFGRGTANKNIFASGAEIKGKRQPVSKSHDTTISPRLVARRGGPATVSDLYTLPNGSSVLGFGESPATLTTLYSSYRGTPVLALPTKQGHTLEESPSSLSNSNPTYQGTPVRTALAKPHVARENAPPSPHPLSNRWAACPDDHRKLFIAFNAAFLIVCGYDRSGITTGPFPTIGLNECIRLCSTTEDCVFVSYRPKTFECYLKFGHGDIHINPDSHGAQLRALMPDVASDPPARPTQPPGRIDSVPFSVPERISVSGPPRVTKISAPIDASSSVVSRPPSSAVHKPPPPPPPPPRSSPPKEHPSRPIPIDGRPTATPAPSKRSSRLQARTPGGIHQELYQGRGPDFTFIPELTIATSTITATLTQYTTTYVSPLPLFLLFFFTPPHWHRHTTN